MFWFRKKKNEFHPESPPESETMRLARADALHEQGLAQAMQGQWSEALRLMLQASHLAPGNAVVQSNLGNLYKVIGQPSQALACYENACRLQADLPDAWNNKGAALHVLGRIVEAQQAYDKAIELHPSYTDAHYNRAILSMEAGDLGRALSGFETALQYHPDHADALNNQSVVLRQLGQLAQAQAVAEQVTRLRPAHGGSWCNLGECYREIGDYPRALACYAKALLHDPAGQQARLHEGMVRLTLGQLEQGWQAYEARWACGGRSLPFDAAQLWQGASLQGKTLLVYAEQGLGDTLQFVRYVPLLAERGARVLLHVQPPLRRVLAGLPGVAAWVDDLNVPLHFDWHCPLMSLPLAFATALHNIPAVWSPMNADQSVCANAPRNVDQEQTLKIGMVWAGNPQHKGDCYRSIALKEWTPLLEWPAQWTALQKDLRAGDAELLLRRQVHEAGSQLGDFADTAALMAKLDLVITVDTSVAHLAASMGKPTWILLPYSPDFRWLLDREDSPWYPGMVRLFRQDATRQWATVMQRVLQALRDKVEEEAHAAGIDS